MFGPIPSECPTCPMTFAESDVQSAHVAPAATRPSAVDPVRMSCSTGVGEPAHCPLIRSPCSLTNSSASPVREWRSVRLFAMRSRFALNHGPVPIRSLCMRRLIAVGGIALDAEVRTPGCAAMTGSRREPLARRVRPCESSEIAGDAGCTRDEKAGRRSGGSGGSAVVFTTGCDESSDQEREDSHHPVRLGSRISRCQRVTPRPGPTPRALPCASSPAAHRRPAGTRL